MKALVLVLFSAVRAIDYSSCYNIACSACGVGYEKHVISTLRSAILFDDGEKPLCFHIFAEDFLHERISAGMEDLRSLSPHVFSYRLYSITYPDELTDKEQNTWKNMFRPCSTQRLFIPLLLKDVPHLVYFNVWRYFDLQNK